MTGKVGAAACAAMVLLSMTACRIPEDTTTPGAPASPTTVASLAVVQVLSATAPPTISDVMVTHQDATILHETLSPPQLTPTPSPTSAQTGEITPGNYTIDVDDTACPPSGCEGVQADVFKPDCTVTVTIGKTDAVIAVIHVNKKSCAIEVG